MIGPVLVRGAFLLLMALGVHQSIVAADLPRPASRSKAQGKEVIRDRYGRLLGDIRPASSGRFEARDRYGRLLGRYDPKMNETRDPYGRLLAKGNTLSGLIVRAAESKGK